MWTPLDATLIEGEDSEPWLSGFLYKPAQAGTYPILGINFCSQTFEALYSQVDGTVLVKTFVLAAFPEGRTQYGSIRKNSLLKYTILAGITLFDT